MDAEARRRRGPASGTEILLQALRKRDDRLALWDVYDMQSCSVKCPCNENLGIRVVRTQCEPRTTSPIANLGVEVFELVLAHVAGEPLDSAMSTDAIRRMLPLALACREHYAIFRNAIRGLAMLPVGTLSRQRERGSLPLFPFSHPCQIHRRPSQRIGKAPAKISDGMIVRACLSFPMLRKLELSQAVAVSDAGVIAVASLVPRLEECRIRANETVSSLSARALSACKHLRVLDMAFCDRMDDDAAPYLRNLPRLRDLNISKWSITDKFCNVMANASSLESLQLTSCEGLTDASCVALAKRAPRLRLLNIRECRRISDAGVRALSNCKALEYIDLSFNDRISDYSTEALGSSLLQLRTVRLSQCAGLTDATATYLGKSSSLQNVKLSWCFLTDETAAALRDCQTIEIINLSGCGRLTDDAIADLAQLPRLRRLKLTYCERLTDQCVLALCKAANAPLEYVDVRHCRRITQMACEVLKTSCGNVLR